MRNNKKISRGEKITSTSDITVDDIAEFVAEEIANGSCRESVKRVVKDTVRPCAIGGVPTVMAGTGTAGYRQPGTGIKITAPGVEIRAGVGVVDGCDGTVDASCPGYMDTLDDGDMLMKSCGNASPKLARTSKYYDIVLQNGEVWTPYTSRRFLPAQYLSLMEFYKGNIDEAIARRYSLKECFKLMDCEIEKLIFMAKNWRTAFAERSLFLTVDNCVEIFHQYLDALKENINDRSKCTFSKRDRVYRRRIQGVGNVELWRQEERTDEGPNGYSSVKVSINPTDWLCETNAAIERANRRLGSVTTYEKALDFLREYLPRINMGTFQDGNGNTRYWLPKAWKEAFKKQGAYYTLKSLIVNRHVRFTTEEGDWRRRTVNAAENAREGLKRLAELRGPNVPAYVVHAILKKSIEQSKFNISNFLRKIRRH